MKHLQKWVFLLLAAGGIIGCDVVAPIYIPTTGGYYSSNISPKIHWVARGDLANPAAAIDGNLSTTARSNNQYAGAEITIDMKRRCMFQTVIIEHGAARGGHCRSVGVSTSVDGKTFKDQHVAPGTRRVTIVSLPATRLARYLRLKAVKPGIGPWVIAEIYLQ